MAEKEYIERETAIKALLKLRSTYRKTQEICAVGGCVVEIKDTVPTADVVEVRHGEWLPYFNEYQGFVTSYNCSLCGRSEREKEPYCHCGAKMDGKGEG